MKKKKKKSSHFTYIYISIHETGLSGNVVASFFPLKIFIPLCFNVLSTVPRENRLTDSLYISIYLSIYLSIDLSNWICQKVPEEIVKPSQFCCRHKVKKKLPFPPPCFGQTTANHHPTPHCGLTLIGNQRQTII